VRSERSVTAGLARLRALGYRLKLG
jgi:hypothetical protein